MEDSIKDLIFEIISEKYEIGQLTCKEYDPNNNHTQEIVRYAIRDEDQNLIRHNDISFFKTFEEAEKILEEIVEQKFKEIKN
tara:strand:+ start:177 stop:422 length:246 start_codon:yes stop_codon:yes gene_type:complete